MSTNCSFRITRTAEDLALTITALSKRLIKLEKRQEALEEYFKNHDIDLPSEEIEILDGVEHLLQECQQLLEAPSKNNTSEKICFEPRKNDESFAA